MRFESHLSEPLAKALYEDRVKVYERIMKFGTVRIETRGQVIITSVVGYRPSAYKGHKE